MDQEKITKSIKENKGILRQLTDLNKKMNDLENKVRKLEENQSNYPNAKELERMPLYEGCID